MQPPKGDFTIDSIVCGDTYVHPQPVLTGTWWWVRWDFGDGTDAGWYNNVHRYKEEGTYDVTLILDNGQCNDTITKKNAIRVKGPFPSIERVDYTCEGNRDVITFIDSTRNADKWTWDFGDGTKSTYTAHTPVISHQYPESWNYQVKLTAEKDDCKLERSVEVYVLKKQKPILSIENEWVCINQPEPFRVAGLEGNLYILSDMSPRYYHKKWEYSDHTTMNGDWGNNSWTWHQDLEGTVTINEMKNDSLRMIMTSYFHNCEDTTNFVSVKLKGVDTKFEVLNDNSCFKSPGFGGLR